MADLPSATTRLDDAAGPISVGTKLVAIFAACPLNADKVPRYYGNVSSALTTHGYFEGLEYAAKHVQDTGLPFMLVPLPIVTAGTVGRVDTSGNTGGSVCSIAVGAYGALAECDVQVDVVTGGTVGTDQIKLNVSLNGGEEFKSVRLGTATSYTIPYVGLVLSFTVGTLVAGDTILTAHSIAPLPDSTGIAAGRVALAAQQKQTRNWIAIGDCANATFAGYYVTAVNAYETANDRFSLVKLQVRDRLPLATLSQTRVSLVGAPNITFAEVGGTGDTITRASGSFLSDGFTTGDTIRVGGTAAAGNKVTCVPATFAASVLTLGSTDLVSEGPLAGVTITSEPTLIFGDNGGSEDTITRNRGSWLDDGFRVGDAITITGTASNNVTKTITGVTALVINVATGSFAAETIGSYGVTIVTGETDSQWVASIDSTFATIDSQKRVDLGAGKLWTYRPIVGYTMRTPVQWADNIRAYQHDVHVATWAKELGPLDGWSMYSPSGVKTEHDDYTEGGSLLAARFTCARSWSNGPTGAFIALSLTRADENSVLSRTHNMAVSNVCQTTVQLETENAVGLSLFLNADGTATGTSLNQIKARVDSALQRNLLQNREGEGARASSFVFTPATDDDLSAVPATLNTTTDLNLRGTIEQINNVIRVK